MGGRSASYRIDKNTGDILTYKTVVEPIIPNGQDSISERRTEWIDILSDENIILCESTDNFKVENIEPIIHKIKKINDKYKEIAKNLSATYPLEIRAGKFTGRTVACFSAKICNKEDMTIFLNANLSKKSKKDIEEETKYNIQAKHWSPCDDNELINHTLAHEYGHFLEKLLFDKKVKNDKQFQENLVPKSLDMAKHINQYVNYEKIFAKQVKYDILKIQKKHFNDSNDFISKYGNYDAFEFFAETFANLVNSKNPTNLAKAMEIYLKENL